MQCELLYGDGTLGPRLPGSPKLLLPRKTKPVGNPERAIREALARPIGSAPFAEAMRTSGKVAIVVNDETRMARTEIFLPILVEELNRTLAPMSCPRQGSCFPGCARVTAEHLDSGGPRAGSTHSRRRLSMTRHRKSSLVVLAVLVLSVALAGTSVAGTFPEKPITLVVHAGAGGGSDIFSRTMSAANDKEKYLPQPIVVENKPGGSGAISFAYVAGKKGDPYFMLTAVTSFLTTPILRKSQIGYKDFTPLANFAFDEYMLMVKGDSKYKTVKDVVAFAKANPKKMTVGGTQLGSSDSVCSYLLERAAGVQLNYIVFNGGGEVNAALMGGHIDLAVSNPGEALELAKANKVRLLGVYSEKRLPGAPDVPTLKEQGLDATYVQNRGLVAPAGIPEDARKTIEVAFQKYMKSETFKKYADENMLSEAWMDGPTFGKWLDKEHARYSELLKEMGLLK